MSTDRREQQQSFWHRQAEPIIVYRTPIDPFRALLPACLQLPPHFPMVSARRHPLPLIHTDPSSRAILSLPAFSCLHTAPVSREHTPPLNTQDPADVSHLPAGLQLPPHRPCGCGPLVGSRHRGGAGRDGLQGQRSGGGGGSTGVGKDLGRASRGRGRAGEGALGDGELRSVGRQVAMEAHRERTRVWGWG